MGGRFLNLFLNHKGNSIKRIELDTTRKKLEGNGRNPTFVSLHPGATHCNTRVPAGLLRHLAPPPPFWSRAPLLVSSVPVLRSPSSIPQPRSISSMFGIPINAGSFPGPFVPAGVGTLAWSAPPLTPLSPPLVLRPLLVRTAKFFGCSAVKQSDSWCKARVRTAAVASSSAAWPLPVAAPAASRVAFRAAPGTPVSRSLAPWAAPPRPAPPYSQAPHSRECPPFGDFTRSSPVVDFSGAGIVMPRRDYDKHALVVLVRRDRGLAHPARTARWKPFSWRRSHRSFLRNVYGSQLKTRWSQCPWGNFWQLSPRRR